MIEYGLEFVIYVFIIQFFISIKYFTYWLLIKKILRLKENIKLLIK
jgi:hypothetical protein